MLNSITYLSESYTPILTEVKRGVPLAIDLETCIQPEWQGRGGSALDPHTGEISLLTLHDGSHTWVVDWLLVGGQPGAAEAVYELLSQAPYVVAANARFEAKWLHKHLGIQLNNWRCVVVLSNLLANATGSKFGKMRGHSLKALCRDLLNVHLEGKGTIQVENWRVRPEDPEGEWWQAKLKYAAGDVQYLLPIHDRLYEALTSPLGKGLDQGDVVAVEMALIPVIAEMELEGMPVARWMMDNIQRELVGNPWEPGYIERLATDILKELVGPQAVRFGVNKRSLALLNNPVALRQALQKYYNFQRLDNAQAEMLRRALEVMEYLSKAETPEQQAESLEEICASEEEQEYFQELLSIDPQDFKARMPLLKQILEYKKLSKLVSMDLREYINPATGRIHSSFNQCYGATGRMTSTDPNVQQINGRTKILVKLDKDNPFGVPNGDGVPAWVTSRHCFVAPPGFSLVSVDYKSQEMLIAAVLSGDKLMLASFEEPPTKTVVVEGKEITYPNPATDLHLLTTKDCCFPQFFEDKPEHEWLKIAKNTTTSSGKALRDVAKTVNFGLIYLATPKTLAKQVYAREEEARRWVERHQNLYQGFWQWAWRHERLANAQGWARNEGFRRIRWVAEDNAKSQGASPGRSGVNHLVQSLGADITKLAMLYLHRLFDGTKARLVSSVHDELVCLVPGVCSMKKASLNPKTGGWEWEWEPDEQVQEWMAKIRREMEKAESQLLKYERGFTEAKAAPFWWH